jgi:glycerate dehydrogenase
MKIVFLERNSLGEDVDLSYFKRLGEVTFYGTSTEEEAMERSREADILVSNKVPMNEKTLAEAHHLKMIALTATGTNNVDFPYVNQRRIPVANVKGYSTDSVVQHTFAMLFYLLEKLPYYDQYVKSGAYSRSSLFSHFAYPYHELAGLQFGIIGLGEIGRMVGIIARAFGCRVCYYSTSGSHEDRVFTRLSLEELLETSDIVSVHAPLNENTLHLMGEEEFFRMKRGAIFLNLGRGPIVVEEALYKALTENWIGGAGLDVLCQEPIRLDNPLLQIQDSNRLLITPHIGWATLEARNRCAREVYENIKAFLRGEARNLVKQ